MKKKVELLVWFEVEVEVDPKTTLRASEGAAEEHAKGLLGGFRTMKLKGIRSFRRGAKWR